MSELSEDNLLETGLNLSDLKWLQQDRRSLDRFFDPGGKSEHHRAGCSLTRSRGNAKESATENIPLFHSGPERPE